MRKIKFLLIIVIIAALLTTVIACDDNDVIDNEIPDIKVSVDGVIMKWTAVPNATGYEVTVGDELFKQKENSMSVEGIAPGKYAVAIKPIIPGTPTTPQIKNVTIEHTEYNPIKLSVPQDLTLQDNVLSWKSVTFATHYAVAVMRSGDKEYTTEVSTTGFTLDTEELGEGEYTIEVKAVTKGDNANLYSQSDVATSDLITVSRLARPKYIAVSDKILSWEAVEGADSYSIKLQQEGEWKTIAHGITETTYDLKSAITKAGTYEIDVVAVSAKAIVLDSLKSENDLAYVYQYSELAAPKLTVDTVNESVSWNKVDGAAKYVIVVKDKSGRIEDKREEIIAGADEVYTYGLSSLPKGTYDVSVKAIADAHSDLADSAWVDHPYVTARVLSAPELSISGRRVSWNGVADALGYRIIADGESLPEILPNDADTYYYDVPEGEETGVHIIKVQALGDGTEYLSATSEELQYRILETVYSIFAQDGKINFGTVPNAVSYKIELLQANEVMYTFTAYEEDEGFNLSAADVDGGSYSVRVQAVGDGAGILDGDKLEYDAQVFKLSAPKDGEVNYVSDGTGGLTWEGAEGNLSYDIAIDGASDKVSGSGTVFYPWKMDRAGEYVITIKTLAPADENNVFDSRVGEYVLHKYHEPVIHGVNKETNVLTWSDTSNINSTKWRIKVGGKTIYVSGRNNMKCDLTDYLNPGTNDITLTTVPSDEEIGVWYESTASSRTVNKLAAPQITVNDTSDGVRWNTVAGASNYRFRIETEDGGLWYEEITGGGTIEFLASSLPPDKTLIARKYIMSVQAYSDAVGEANIISSAYNRMTHEVKNLSKVGNVRIDGSRYLAFDGNVFSDGYDVIIDGQLTHIKENRYDLSHLGAGEHSATILVVGDGFNYATDAVGMQLNLVKLETASGLNINDHTLSWNGIAGIKSYSVKILYESGEEQVIAAETNSLNLRGIKDNGKPLLKAGKINILVRAETDGSEYADNGLHGDFSEACATEKLEVTGVKIGSLTTWNKVAGAEKYTVTITKEGIEEPRIRDIGKESTSYTLELEEDAGRYNFMMSAEGDGRQYLNSERTEEITFIKEVAPTNVSIGEGKLSWSIAESTMGEKYKIRIDGVNDYTGEGSEFILPRLSADRNHSIEVKVFNNDFDKDGIYRLESGYSAKIMVTPLMAPENIEVRDGMIVSDAVENAAGYGLIVGDRLIKTVYQTAADGRVYFDELGLGGGTHRAGVFTMGRGCGNSGTIFVDGTLSKTMDIKVLNLSDVEVEVEMADNVIRVPVEADKVGRVEIRIEDNAVAFADADDFVPSENGGVVAVYTYERGELQQGKNSVNIRLIGKNDYVSSDYILKELENDTPANLPSAKDYRYADGILYWESAVKVHAATIIINGNTLQYSKSGGEADYEHELSVSEYVETGENKYSIQLTPCSESTCSNCDNRFEGPVIAGTFRILEKVTGVNARDSGLAWDADSYALTYMITVTSGAGTKQYTTSQTSLGIDHWSKNYLSRGENIITVRAMGDNDTIHHGAPSDEVRVTPTVEFIQPGNLTYDTESNKLIWDKSYSSRYDIYDSSSEEPIAVAETEGGKASYLLDDMPVGKNNVYIKGIGDGWNYLDSTRKYTVTLYKMGVPTDLDVSENVLSWRPAQQLPGVDNRYIVMRSDEAGNKPLANTSEPKYLIDAWSAGEYELTVVATKGEGADEESDSEFTINSEASASVKVTVLGETGTRIDETGLYVSAAVLNALKYAVTVSISGESVTYNADNSVEYPIVKSFDTAGTYTVSVKALGNGTNIIDGKLNTSEYEVKRLDAPSYSIDKINERLRFNAVDGAAGYIIDGIDAEQLLVDLSQVEANFNKTVTAVAKGRNMFSLDSVPSEVEISRPGAVTGLTVADGKLTWDNDAMHAYQVYMSGNRLADIDDYSRTFNIPKLVDAGLYTFSVRVACPDAECDKKGCANMLYSRFAESKVEQLAKINGINIGPDGVIRWSAQPAAYGYGLRVTYGVIGMVTQIIEADLPAGQNSYTLSETKFDVQGDYAVYVIAKGNNAGVIAGDESLPFVHTVTKNEISGITMTGTAVSWQTNTQNVAFKFKLTRGGIIEEIENYDKNSYDAEKLSSGEYVLTLTAVGDNIFTIDSTETVYEFNKLYAPSNMIIWDSALSWNAVTGSAGYEVIVYERDGKEHKRVSLPGSDTVSAQLDEIIAAQGSYYIEVIALGDTSANVMNSSAGGRADVAKLGEVQAVIGQTTVWAAVNNAICYELYLDDTETPILTTTETSLVIELNDSAEHTLYIRAVGNGTSVLSSGLYSGHKIRRGEAPTDITVSGGRIQWVHSGTNARFKVRVGGVFEQTVYGNSCDIPLMVAGRLNAVEVKTLGSGRDANGVYQLESAYASAASGITSLDKVTGIALDKFSALKWNVVEGATGYNVYSVNTETYEYTLLATTVTASISHLQLSAGEKTVAVAAVGDGTNTFSSISDDYVKVSIIAPIFDMAVTDSIIIFDSPYKKPQPNAKAVFSYEIVINGVVQEGEITLSFGKYRFNIPDGALREGENVVAVRVIRSRNETDDVVLPTDKDTTPSAHDNEMSSAAVNVIVTLNTDGSTTLD